MKLILKILLYLEKRRFLTEMKSLCEVFLGDLNEKTLRKFPPLRFLLEVDVIDLLDVFPDVGDFLIKEPLKWQRCCNEILFACLKSLDNDMIQNIQATQVGVNIRFKSMPYFLTNKHRKYENIVSLRGLLVNITKPTSYVYHTVWSCPDECEGNEVIMHFIPKVPPKCYLCRNTLFENSGLRRCGDQVQATFKLNNELLSKNYTIVDDLIPNLKIGKKYVINAVILKKLIAIWSIEEFQILPAPITTPVPRDIRELYESCKGIPWKFIYCLASSIGLHVCPLNTFMNIKISLLLSLVSVKANSLTSSPIIHFLSGGFDTGYIGKIMEQAALLADSYTYLGTTHNSTTTTLIGASGGVCVMALPLQAYSQNQIHSVLSAIETGEISDGVNKTTLQCAVWAQGMDFKKIILYNVGSIFGFVCRGDYGEYTDELVDYALEEAIVLPQTDKHERQALKDISIYIDLVAGLKVKLTKSAENLLRCYFLTARRERPKVVTIGNLGALIAICATSAKLCRRDIAKNDDAIFAIWLHVSGMPEPRLAPDEYLQTPADIKKLKKVIDNFYSWLEQFIGYSISDPSE
ncbi:minichromosome maintenance domain-containing protein 2-like [Vanessa atalanta]|uniref:minichromosome maintenance domain-containing protein 2-like n=1 Tax=Vanessa atalanta TaxID=42275 RepID=UPI001FCCD66C|nr:minichromosome maintenance domain-containing protein 2-like [Vanessa atalanta]